ncbi:MAG: bifunctional riboflavin kinase/FAD synthetase [Pseudomonadota bacterium]
MELIRGLHNLRARHQGCVLTIGVFDGVHVGHKTLLSRLAVLGEDYDLPSVLMCFESHPQEVLDYLVTPARITPFREKMMALMETTVERVLCVKFDHAFASLAPESFVEDILVKRLGVRHLVVGDDFRFGFEAQGDFDFLGRMGRRHGFDVHRRDTHRIAGDRVSSTRIRNLLALGQLDTAAELLGRRYAVSGRVRFGRQLGRTIGFPTANVALRRKVSPLSGVFAVQVQLAGEATPRPAVANIGHRPTVGGTEHLLEVHLLDYLGDLYGVYVNVELMMKIREERRFEGLDPLKAQIARDADTAREYFLEHPIDAPSGRGVT